jgi:hypothetical protein
MGNKYYKMKHVPTGLYFQPHKHRGSHLSPNGKIYHTNANGIETGQYGKKVFTVCCEKDSRIHKLTVDKLAWAETSWRSFGQLKADTNYSDWVKEYI